VDPLVIVAKLQRILQDNLQRIGDTMISGGIDNMEKYQYMLGQAVLTSTCFRKSLTC